MGKLRQLIALMLVIHRGIFPMDGELPARIRPFEPQKDRPFIEQLLREELDTIFLSERRFEREKDREEAIQLIQQQWHAQVLEVQNAAVGFIAYDDHAINVLAVQNDHRNKTYGTQLLQKAMQAMRGSIFISVKKNNMIARHLYTKLGFKPIKACGSYITLKSQDDSE